MPTAAAQSHCTPHPGQQTAAAAAAAAAGSALHRGHDRSGPAAAAWPGGGLLAPGVVYSVTGLQP